MSQQKKSCSALLALSVSLDKRSEAHLLVDVEGVEYRDARLIGLDRLAAMPAHLRERMIGLQHHERVADIGEERYGLYGLKAVGAHMHQALKRGAIKRCAQRVLPSIAGAIEENS